jgi:hypothetical protein
MLQFSQNLMFFYKNNNIFFTL